MEKIKMPVPIAELDGDEMTHILWGMIKDQLIKPFVDLNTEYYDLSLPNRDRTEDAVTRQAAEAIAETTGAAVRTFQSCQTVSRADFDNGVTYLQLMEANVDALREGLS